MFLYLAKRSHDLSQAIIMGESAGGTLSLELGIKLRDGNHILPRAIIALSPPTNHADELLSHLSNRAMDYMLRGNYTSYQQKEAVYGWAVANSRVALLDLYIST
ncbi:alpha/beta hydrolase fold domain-containing protein [Streptococcus suis]|uniref:alpha/beta hydrolase fold domain-containing protein n=1 Tax=Streptococcus suis TaxID=1307 RepID=UPI00225C1551|nr:alpha/beta hydrolase fold domain-containing protein [Streptococcus suis]